jgi:hypothetical protein
MKDNLKQMEDDLKKNGRRPTKWKEIEDNLKNEEEKCKT